MKAKTFLIALVVLTLLTSLSYAKIWIVDNNGGSKIADFTTIQAAHDGAADGDTLYVIGSPTNYDGLVCVKMLVIFGPGYFLNENPKTQMNVNPAQLSSIQFKEGSDGSIIQGIQITEYSSITVNAANITIKNNRITCRRTAIGLTEGANNCLITQNIISGGESGTGEGYAAIDVPSNVAISNIVISNNILLGNGVGALRTRDAKCLIKNNFIWICGSITNSSVYNNIFDSPSHFGTTFSGFGENSSTYNCIFTYPIHLDADPAKYPNCQYEIQLTDIFVGITGNSTDGQYQLKEGSPAIGAGLNGVDCGMFGGANPYVLSGLPPIPAIYEADIATTGSIDDGLPVKIKVKAHN